MIENFKKRLVNVIYTDIEYNTDDIREKWEFFGLFNKEMYKLLSDHRTALLGFDGSDEFLEFGKLLEALGKVNNKKYKSDGAEVYHPMRRYMDFMVVIVDVLKNSRFFNNDALMVALVCSLRKNLDTIDLAVQAAENLDRGRGVKKTNVIPMATLKKLKTAANKWYSKEAADTLFIFSLNPHGRI